MLVRRSICCWTLLACGGAVSSTGGPGGGACTLQGGTYTQHFTAEAGGTDCPAIPDQTISISGTETLSGDAGSSPIGSGSGCSTSVSSSTCTFTADCTFSSGGFTTTTTTSLTLDGTSATGKETLKSTDSSGNVTSNCTYDMTMTKG